jgi:hypothetical protein
MSVDKQANVLRRAAKEASGSRPRARGGKRALLRTRDFWRALSAAAQALPDAPMLQRVHD